MEEKENMNGDSDERREEEKQDNDDEVRSGLKVLPKSDCESLEKRFPEISDPGLGSEGEDGNIEDKGKASEYGKETSWDRVDRLSAEREHKRLHHMGAPLLTDAKILSEVMGIMRAVVSDFAKFQLEVKDKFNLLSKRNEVLIFNLLKTGLYDIADVERMEGGGGIRVTRPPKDNKGSRVAKDNKKIAEVVIHVDHEFHRCATCGDEIVKDKELYLLYDHAKQGNTIRVFDAESCRAFWVQQNSSPGLGWSDDVTTIRNLASGYYAHFDIKLDVMKNDINNFIDWIEAGAKDKDSQQSLIIGPETRGGRSKQIRWADEGIKTLEKYGQEFTFRFDPDQYLTRSAYQAAVIEEFIEFVRGELKKDVAAEERS